MRKRDRDAALVGKKVHIADGEAVQTVILRAFAHILRAILTMR